MNNQTSRQQKVSVTAPKQSKVDLSNRNLTTLDFFRLQPIYTKEMLPGDTFNVNVRSLINVAPLAQRTYSSFHVDLHYFFVPNRILWSDWNNYFFGNNRSGQQTYTHPYIQYQDLVNVISGSSNKAKEYHRVLGSLGYPVNAYNQEGTGIPFLPNQTRFNDLPLRAYLQIWWDYYRDSVNIEEYQKYAYIFDPSAIYKPERLTHFVKYRAYKKDYISTLLTNPQFGSKASSAKVSNLGWSDNSTGSFVVAGTNLSYRIDLTKQGSPSVSWLQELSIPVLRAANAAQRWLERMNISGTRPLERILSVFGVNDSSERLDMAELVGSDVIPVQVDGLVNTGSSDRITSDNSRNNAFGMFDVSDSQPATGQGVSTGYAHGAEQGKNVQYHAVEHGFFMVIASVIPDFSDPYCIDRMLLRGCSTVNADRFDYYTPDMDGIGYQPVTLPEVCTPSPDCNPAWSDYYDLFQLVGYQPKYEEYRVSRDITSGDFTNWISKNSLRLASIIRDFSAYIDDPRDLIAGIDTTTPGFDDRAYFDRMFAISAPEYDHFICNFNIINDALRPITSAELPTELSNLANSDTIDISNGGVRL